VILSWQLFLSLDQLNALVTRLEDEAWWSQDDDFKSAYEELCDAREHAIRREVNRPVWGDFDESVGGGGA
jgi:hypothetical protein